MANIGIITAQGVWRTLLKCSPARTGPVGILALRQRVNRPKKGLPSFGMCLPPLWGPPRGEKSVPALRIRPRIISAEGPHVALRVLAGVVAPAIVLRLRRAGDLGARGLGAREM